MKKTVKMKKLMIGLYCVLGVLTSCDNENGPGSTPPLKKLKFVSKIPETASFGEVTSVKITITKDVTLGSTNYATYYENNDDKNGKDAHDVILTIDATTHEINMLLMASSIGETYYVQKFELLDADGKVRLYMPGNKVEPFTLKIDGDNEISIEISLKVAKEGTLARISPIISTHLVKIDGHSFDLHFQYPDGPFGYFSINHSIDITLTYAGAELISKEVGKDIFSTIKKSNGVKIILPDVKTYYKNDFTFKAVLNNPGEKTNTRVQHKFIIPDDISDQIRKGSVFITEIKNQTPTIKGDKISVDSGGITITSKLSSPIIQEDKDGDQLTKIYQWYIADDEEGTNSTRIKGEETNILDLSNIDIATAATSAGMAVGKYIMVRVIADDGIQKAQKDLYAPFVKPTS